MASNPRTWYPIAVLLSFANVVAFGFAVVPGPPWHAAAHAGLAVAFAFWAQQLKARLRAPRSDRQDEGEVEALRDEVEQLRRAMSELQERQDFVERLLSQAREMERLPGREPDRLP